VRGSLNRDMTPNKLGKQGNILQTNTSLSSSDTNIVNIKNQAGSQKENGRNIKTPQTSNQNTNTSSKASEANQMNSGQKPTRLTLKMLSQNNKQKMQ